MPNAKECPLCGCEMKIRVTENLVQIPGNPNATKSTTREWICPECDYFEDCDEDN